MQTEEIWRDIPGYTGRYQASNLGRIRSVDKNVIKRSGVTEFYKGKILKAFIGTGGYLYITIAKEPNKFHNRRLQDDLTQDVVIDPSIV